jgi:SAM-dependent methyltransferase
MSNYISDWAPHYSTKSGFRQWPSEELAGFISGRTFHLVLECGTANGRNLRLWNEDTYAVGLDAYLPVLSKARAFVTRGALVGGDVTRLPFRDGAFDLCVDCMTSQHLPWAEHAALYTEYRRVLKPGGSLWLYHLDCKTVSTRGEWQGGSDWAGLALFPDVDFFCLPIPTQLADVVEAAGFRMPTVRGLAREYPDGQVAHYSIIEAEAK